MNCFSPFPLGLVVLLAASVFSFGKDSQASLEKRFEAKVKPFMATYCLECHNKEKTKGDLDLSPYTSMADVARGSAHWEMALERLEAKEMPPKKATKQPGESERKEVIQWIQAARRFEAEKNAGDPGPVLARRLSNAEFDYTVRDLTSVEMHPTREFPVDPANQAGFDNTGESLTMSPALLKKYLGAAKEISEHAVLTPDGIEFASHLMLADTDRDKYCILRIVDFYQRQPTDYADYFAAAWKYKNRAKSKMTLAEIAAQEKVSPSYLATIWAALNAPEEVGPIAKLQSMFKALPTPPRGQPAPDIRKACEAMRDFVVSLRAKIVPDVKNLSAPEINPSAQALVLWKDRTWAANRRKFDPALLQVGGAVTQADEEKNKPASFNRKKVKTKTREADENLYVPADATARAKYEAAFARFAALFPDAFYIKERARSFVDPEEEKANGNVGRLLSAGLHNMTGYFRDDGPLYEMILDDAGRRELDRLWDDFNFVASVPQRMHQSTIYFERTDSRFLMDAEFDFARAEDKDATSEAKVKKLGELYYAKAQRLDASSNVLAAIKDHFERVWIDLRRMEQIAAAAEAKHLVALQTFAESAFRRPLVNDERASVIAFYKSMREKEGLAHDEAVRDSIASILMSPNFLYRVDLIGEGKAVQPLSDYALASRLSYFLWSTMPDAELLQRAAAGDLRRPQVLAAQARRMLKDPRARALATEFLGNWLDIRRFEELNSVDRDRFPQFNNELRSAMFEEPIRFFMDAITENRSALDFIYGQHTFVNPALARHYGLPELTITSNQWVRVDDARPYGRGGLLPMAVFLTKNSPGLRTSPVKRGYWVVRNILGERIPPPPPVVPELPADESKMGELTLRDALAKHRADPACAGCHARFDSYGLVFEGYGPVGEKRSLDLGGKPVDVRASFADGSEESGVAGLQHYLKKKREDDFLENLCRKLLAYGLGRTLILSDDSTVREMRAKLAANHFQFDTLVECIVTSRQFSHKRGVENVARN